MNLNTLENIITIFEQIDNINDTTRDIIDDNYEIACDIKEKLYLEYPILVKIDVISKTKTWRNLIHAHNQLVDKFENKYWYLNSINERFILDTSNTKEEKEHLKKLAKTIRNNKYYGYYMHYHFLPITVQQEMECLEQIEQLIDLFQLKIDNMNKTKKSRAA